MKNILVVNINWLGDAIFSTPVFKALKKIYPQAKITCLCVPRVKDVLVHCPYIDSIIIYDERGQHCFPWSKLKLICHLRKQQFDAAFLLHRSMTRALMVWLAGIPIRVGFSKAAFLLTDAIEAPSDELHRSDAYLKVLEAYGLKVDGRLCELRLELEDMQSLDKKLVDHGIADGEDFIVFNCGGNWDLKRWPITYWAELIGKVNSAFDIKVLLSGGPLDKSLCETIMREAKSLKVINLAGQTTLGESLALFKRSRAVVSADSGPLHLANSVGANVVGIFGPTSPKITGPRGVGGVEILFKDVGCNKAPCYHLACSNNLCMQAVGVDDVAQALQKFLN